MNGFSYNGGYDQNGMPQEGDVSANEMMMLGQDGMGGMSNKPGGQSLDDIVNQNAKVIRRQSMPQGFGTTQNALDAAGMSGMSMGEFGGGINAGQLSNFNFDPNAVLNHTGMMPDNSSSVQNPQQGDFGSRASNNDLALQTTFSGSNSAYSNIMQHPSSAYASPAHATSAMDMNMNNSFVDAGLAAQMDLSVDHDMGNFGNDQMNMGLYNTAQYGDSTMASPMHNDHSKSTPTSVHGRGYEGGNGVASGMNSQYGGGRSDHSSIAQHNSRQQQTHHRPDVASPLRTELTSQGAGMNTPMSASRQHANSGFTAQPQRRTSAPNQAGESQKFNGVNRTPNVDPSNYNPNNQGLDWKQPEGGWPSTMIGRPHMQSAFKNIYSSTGFDMLGVLVSASRVIYIVRNGAVLTLS